jgi:hypothetical protein
MTKSRDRPMCGASRRSSRAHSEWKVESHTPFGLGAEQRPDAIAHLAGGLVRERDGEHLVRPRMSVADQVRDPERDDPRLARSRARENQQRTIGMQNRFTLFGIELVEEIHSRGPSSIAAAVR